MGPFGIPWPIASIYIVTFIGVPIVVEVLLRSKWWKKSSDYYYSFNEKKE